MDMAAGDSGPVTKLDDGSEPKTRSVRKAGRWAVMLAVPLLVAAGAYYYWEIAGQTISTDNAYVQQDKVSVSAEVAGPIAEVLVKEGEEVEPGQPLFRIDPAPYELAVREAEASLAAAQVDVQSLSTDYRATDVDIASAREDIAFARTNFDRQAELWERGFTTRSDYDASKYRLEQAQAKLSLAQANAAKARAKLASAPSMPGQNPDVAAAQVRLDQARLNLKRTTVYAPVAGKVAQVERLQRGQQIMTGIPALSLVVNNRSWIEANFKETDLDRMHAGQKAQIHFDAYPELDIEGRVSSIGAGTGSEFSMLPAQNATGNWVKVTQRVPVRIDFKTDTDRPLIAGLSANVSVKVEQED